MAWSYEIDPLRRLVTVVVEGDLTDADLLEGSAQLRDDPAFSPDCTQLVDLLRANCVGVTASGVASLEEDSPLFSAESRRAIAASTDYCYWLGRLFKVSRDEKAGQIQIFQDLDGARRWLGLL